MTVADDEELYSAAALEIGRDLPLTFQYRTELSVIAELGLPDPRSAREEDARNAGRFRDPWPDRRAGKGLPFGEGPVVFIDGQLRGDSERATQSPIFGASPSHYQHRSAVVPPCE